MNENLDKINWNHLSENQNIYEIDVKKIELKEEFVEELMKICFHPKRVQYYLENYGYDIVNEEYNNFL